MSDVRPKIIDPTKIIGLKLEPNKFLITDKSAILYALGIGFSQGIDRIKNRSIKRIRYEIYKRNRF
jgi:hypothetical protein